jgi:hypothetical protein
MSQLTEDYLNSLQEGKALTIANKILAFMGVGGPSGRPIRIHGVARKRCKVNCEKMYLKKTGGVSKRAGFCSQACDLAYIKGIINTIKQNRSTICKKGMLGRKKINPDLCEKWITRHLPQLEAEANSMEMMLKPRSL